MSTNEPGNEIKDLLARLGDESLKKAHASVLISFSQMLDYIENTIKPVRQKDIKHLLEVYKEMSQEYFARFELSLLEEIEKRCKTKEQCKLAKRLIDSNPLTKDKETDAMKKAEELLDENREMAAIEYKNLVENFATLLQDALNKLTDEWQRLGTIAVASQALAKDQELIQSLETVVEVAAYSIGIEAQRIVVVPGKEFALYFFAYLENLIVFTVPVYSVQAPWAWSIFWHELAGHQVRWLDNGNIMIDGNKLSSINGIGAKLQRFHERYQALKSKKKKDTLIKVVMRGNRFGYDYLKELFSAKKLDLSDLGSFDHQFERMMLKLPQKNQFKVYEKMKMEGWCVDWFKELFEDAWSVLTIRANFLIFLQDTLNRHINIDGRHPLPRIRLGVAQELLKLSYKDEEDVSQSIIRLHPRFSKHEKTVIKIATRQLLRFLSLIIAASYKFEDPADPEIQDFNKQKGKNLEDLREIGISDIADGVRCTIQDAICRWSSFHETDEPTKAARDCAEEIIAMFSNSEYVKMRKPKENLEPSYAKLLKKENGEDKDYKELLELSFYDADFNVASVNNVYHYSHRKFDTARLHSVPADVAMGAVMFECDGIPKRTSIESWNTAAVSGFKIA